MTPFLGHNYIGDQLSAALQQFAELTSLREQNVGRILLNGYPTGVEVCDSMVHGGPYPATSVGTLAISRPAVTRS